jgi:hypothetical protein
MTLGPGPGLRDALAVSGQGERDSPPKVGFAQDSSLEGDGFEL